MTLQTIQYAGRSHKGRREAQEDTYAVRMFQRFDDDGTGVGAGPSELVAVVADGMGGHVGGARASNLAARQFLASFPRLEGSVEKRLLTALDASNRRIGEEIADQPELAGMGSTLVGLSLDAGGLHWISVGDSLLYLWHNGRIRRLNEDHSLAPVLDGLVAQGRMEAHDSLHHPKRNMLRSAVMGEEIELVDVSRSPLTMQGGDWLIAASDGIAGLKPSDLEQILSLNAPKGADRLADALITAVKRIGNPRQDNITVVVIGLEFVDQ